MPPRQNLSVSAVPLNNQTANDAQHNVPAVAQAPVWQASAATAGGLQRRAPALACCFGMQLRPDRPTWETGVNRWGAVHKGLHATFVCKEIKKALRDNSCELNLSNRSLHSIPVELGQARELIKLHLDYNKFKVLPLDLGQLAKLEHLSLSRNELITLPAERWRATALKKLSLDHNRLSSLPEEIARLPHLECLDLRNNIFTHVPRVLLEARSTAAIYLEGNPLLDSEITAVQTAIADRKAKGLSVPKLSLPSISHPTPQRSYAAYSHNHYRGRGADGG